jgi:hypothetical protein
MFNKLKDLFEFSLIEVLTIIFFAAIGYAFNYKINLYSQLGVSWFLGSVSPNYVFVTSIHFITSSVMGASLGLLITSQKFEKHLLKIMFGVLFICLILGGFIVIGFDLIVTYLGGYSSSLLFVFYGLMTTYYIVLLRLNLFIRKNMKNDGEPTEQSFLFVWIIIAFGLYFLTPAFIGNIEAKNIEARPELFLTLVKLKDNSEKWFLVELLNDKALVKKEGVEKTYKLVDYKDIDLYQDVSNKK